MEGEKRTLFALDRLLNLIKNSNKAGKFTQAKEYENYYNTVRSRDRIKKLIKGTIHEIKGK